MGVGTKGLTKRLESVLLANNIPLNFTQESFQAQIQNKKLHPDRINPVVKPMRRRSGSTCTSIKRNVVSPVERMKNINLIP